MEPEIPQEGFYVDVGAYHPVRFSNTYYFYKRGWRGLNIDARPGLRRPFLKARPRDLFVESGVSDERGELTYHMFNEPALNGFDPDLSAERDGALSFREIGRRSVPVAPLVDLLDRHLPAGRSIDFLSIDVEGFDDRVVRSNDWTRHRPRWVLVEVVGKTLTSALASPTVAHLESAGYAAVARAASTMIFRAGEDAGGIAFPLEHDRA